MKKFTLLFAMILVAVFVYAQDEVKNPTEDINTVFGKSENIKLGWYVGIDGGYTKFDTRDVWLSGFSAGMVVNHTFTIGGWGRSFIHSHGMYNPNVTETSGGYLDGAYGGLLMEYILMPKSVVHVSFPLLIGGGSISYVNDQDDNYCENNWESYDDDEVMDKDDFFVIEPGVRAELNILKFMRLNAGISYRYTAGVDLINTSDTFMNNFTATVGLRFGKF
jgi:hypothetical protein